ncbi:MAG: DUF2283 domain-containing protein [Sulfolobales archaeon]
MRKFSEEISKKKLFIEDIEKNLWIEYDKQNDILYLYFAPENEEPEESILIGEDTVIAVKEDKLISITFINFSKRVNLEK